MAFPNFKKDDGGDKPKKGGFKEAKKNAAKKCGKGGCKK